MNKSPNHILYRSCFRSGSTFGPPPAQLVTASPCDRHSNVEKGGCGHVLGEFDSVFAALKAPAHVSVAPISPRRNATGREPVQRHEMRIQRHSGRRGWGGSLKRTTRPPTTPPPFRSRSGS